MATVDVLNWKNKKVDSIDLSPEVFEKPVNVELMQTVVKWQLACKRQGTHMAKSKGLVSGGGKKPYKQKGTGNARRGSNRSPLIRGGGAIFGPVPRDYSYSLPKKVRMSGLKSALSYLYSEGKLKVVDSLECSGKTKEVFENLKSLGTKKTVLVGSEKGSMMQRASANIPKCVYLTTEGLNVFDLLKYDHVIFEKDSVDQVQKRLGVEA
jgi:large subunit ribosomal protein L4